MRHRQHIAGAVLAVAVALGALAGCGNGSSDSPSHTPSVATVTPTSQAPTTPVTTPPTTPPTTTPAATTAPATTAPPSTKPATPKPTHKAAPTHTQAPVIKRTAAPPVATTHASKANYCSIRSNAGNCYKAGQFCRKSDLGASTTDASGRRITCGMESGRPHWHY